jgi:hypothetical protein
MAPGERPPSSVSAFRVPPDDHDPWLELIQRDADSWPAAEDLPEPQERPERTQRTQRTRRVPTAPLDPEPGQEQAAPGPARRQPTAPDRRPGRLIRPYLISGGRTSSDNAELEIEALVATTALGQARSRALSGERRQIAVMCRDVLSVAEVSAHLDVPLGVACVVVGDMADEGLVQLHRPASPDARPDLALLERVLYGLRDL